MRAAAVAVLAACSAPDEAGSMRRDAGRSDAIPYPAEGGCEVTQRPLCADGNWARILDVFPVDGSTCGTLGEGAFVTSCPTGPEASGIGNCGGLSSAPSNSCGLRMEAFVAKPETFRATCKWQNIEPATAIILHVTSVYGLGASVYGLGDGFATIDWVRIRAGTSEPVIDISHDGLAWVPYKGGMPSGAQTSEISLEVYAGLGPLMYEHNAIELAEAVFVCP